MYEYRILLAEQHRRDEIVRMNANARRREALVQSEKATPPSNPTRPTRRHWPRLIWALRRSLTA